MDRITRAIDVGYGNTKFTTHNSLNGFGLKDFPSITPRARNQVGFDETKLDVIEINADGERYLVGKDSLSFANHNEPLRLDEAYCLSNGYLALVRGALYQMRLQKIDMLVVGLPFTTYAQYKERLSQRLTGKHAVPNWFSVTAGTQNNIEVEVANVHVFPQPVGAFYNYYVPRGLHEKMAEEGVLVMDVGRGTFDWFVSCNGNADIPRSGSYLGGMAAVVESVAEAIQPGLKDQIRVLDRIDRALRTRKSCNINGKPILVMNYQNAIAQTINTAISAMMSKLQVYSDIDTIILTGGGSSIWYPVVQQVFSDRSVICEENPLTTNVRGFQLVGEQLAEKLGPHRFSALS